MLKDITKVQNCYLAVNSYYFGQQEKIKSQSQTANGVEIFYITQGSAEFVINNTKIILVDGDVIVIDKDTNYKYSISKKCKFYYLSIKNFPIDENSGICLNAYDTLLHCNSFIEVFYLKEFIVLKSVQLKGMLEKLFAFLNKNRTIFYNHYYTQVMLCALLLEINDCYLSDYTNNPYIGKIVNYLTNNFYYDITVEDIAKNVSLNITYLQKLFVKEMGVTLFDYITELRVTKSINMMRSTQLSCIEIALQTGFNNRQTFFNAFKKVTGYSPTQFKKYLAKPTLTPLVILNSSHTN